MYIYFTLHCCRSLIDHRQTEEYYSFMRRAAKTMAAVCLLYFKKYYAMLL